MSNEFLPCPHESEGAKGSREDDMVVVERNEDGVPTIWCDPEVVDIVMALNAAGIRTVASCSGHGIRPGCISLADGRELVIAPDYDTARELCSVHQGINGEPSQYASTSSREALADAAAPKMMEGNVRE